MADDCYLEDQEIEIFLVSDSVVRSLHSAEVQTCAAVPRTYSRYGDRTFAAAEPRLWNSLPVQLRNPDMQLYTTAEGTPFCSPWTRRSSTLDM